MTMFYMAVVDGVPSNILTTHQSEGLLPVRFSNRPADTAFLIVEERRFEVVDDEIFERWPVRNRTLQEIEEIMSLPHWQKLPMVLDAAKEMRAKRDRLLRDNVDAINPMRWETMTEEEKDEWRTYRAALLDVPQQKSFPFAIDWPETPA